MEKLRKRLNAWNDGKGGPRKGDWMAALAIVAILTLFFCFLKDFKLTVTQSLTFDSCLFNGRLKDFYTIVNKQAFWVLRCCLGKKFKCRCELFHY